MSEDLQLLTTQELLGLPPVKYLIEGLIPEEGFVGLCGASGEGKTFIAADWAICLSEGRPWLGRFPTTQCPVVYVAAEGGRGMQKRIRASMEYYQYDDLSALYFLIKPLYVREEGTVERFLDMLEEKDIWPGLIVIDTLSRSFGGGEENASADMGAFVDQITRLAAGRHMAALVVHHLNAQGSRERGHTAFKSGLDAMFMCTATKGPNGEFLRIELANVKQKDGAEAPTIYLKPVEGTTHSLVFEETTAPEPKKRGPAEPKPMRKVDMLTVLGSHPEGLLFKEFMLAAQIPLSTFKRRLAQLKEDGLIYKDNDGRWFTYPANIDLIHEEETK